MEIIFGFRLAVNIFRHFHSTLRTCIAACVQGCILIFDHFQLPRVLLIGYFRLLENAYTFDTFHPVLDEQKPFVMSCQTFILLLIEGEVR